MPFFKRKPGKTDEPEFIKRADVKCKRINVNYLPPDELLPQMATDKLAAGRLTPVNYYATKQRFIAALVYYLPDYSQAKIRYTFYVNEKPEKTSDFFELSYDSLSMLLAKIGMYIDK